MKRLSEWFWRRWTARMRTQRAVYAAAVAYRDEFEATLLVCRKLDTDAKHATAKMAVRNVTSSVSE